MKNSTQKHGEHMIVASDHIEIQSTIAALLKAIDQREWSSLSQFFADDVTTDFSGFLNGGIRQKTGEKLATDWTNFFSNTFVATHHLLSIPVIEHHNENAAMQVAFEGRYFYSQDGKETWQLNGQLAIKLFNYRGQWKITSLTIDQCMQSGKHPLPDVAL